MIAIRVDTGRACECRCGKSSSKGASDVDDVAVVAVVGVDVSAALNYGGW